MKRTKVLVMKESGSSLNNEEQTMSGPSLILAKSVELRMPAIEKIILNKPCVTIGRSLDVDHCILSKSISRIHCEIRQLPTKHDLADEWVIKDKSANGVFINGERITANEDYKLTDGDLVELSCDTTPIVAYVFKANATYTSPQPNSLAAKRLKSVQDAGTDTLEGKTEAVPLIQDDSQASARLELQKKNEDLLGELHKMEEMMKQREINLRQEWELELESKRREEELKLEKCKKEIEESKEEEWAEKLKVLNHRHKTALEEKMALSRMLRDMNEDKSKEIEIEKEKECLEQKLKMKDVECSALLQKLDEVTARNAATEENAIKLRDDLVKNVSETMEMELQCSICSEMFVKAATLNCAHSYCTYCINEWRKKKDECPICRKPIVSLTPSLVLDSFIDKIVETLDTTLKDRRKELVEERKNMPVQNIINPVIRIQAQPNPTAARQETRRRGGGAARGRQQATVITLLPQQAGAAGRLQAPNANFNTIRMTGNQHSDAINAAIRAVLPGFRIAPNQARGFFVQQVTNGAPPAQQHVMQPPNRVPLQQRGSSAALPSNRAPQRGGAAMQPAIRMPPPVGAAIQPPNRMPVPIRATMQPPNRRGGIAQAVNAGVPTQAVNPIEISSESSEGSDNSDADVGGYFPGYGHCFRCGSNNHWANGCPF